MLNGRSNFATVQVGEYIYAFGGFCCRGASGETHQPVLAEFTERYSITSNKWEQVEVAGAPSLAAFAWCSKHKDAGEIAVLGGSDGNVMNQDFYTIDFRNLKATKSNAPFEFGTCMGHLSYHSAS